MKGLTGRDHGIPEYVALLKEYSQHIEYVRGSNKDPVYKALLVCQHFGRFLLDNYGEIPQKITKLHIVAYMKDLAKGRQRNTVVTQLVRLKRFFKYLERVGAITDNPLDGIRLKPYPPKIGEILTLKEIDKLMNSLGNTTVYDLRNAAIIETLYSMGIRVAELCNIELQDYVPGQGYIKIKGKGNVERLTPIGSYAVAAIDLYLTRRDEIARRRRRYQALFVSAHGRKLSRMDICRILTAQSKIAGIKHTTAHMLRRSCATHMLQAGAPLRYIQEQLGHKNIKATQRYTNLTIDDLLRVYANARRAINENDVHDRDLEAQQPGCDLTEQ